MEVILILVSIIALIMTVTGSINLFRNRYYMAITVIGIIIAVFVLAYDVVYLINNL